MPLQTALSRIRRLQRAGRWLAALLILTALTTLLTLIAGLLDAWLAPEPPARTLLITTLLLLTALTASALLLLASRFSEKRAALTADTILASPRSPITAALTLTLATEPSTPLSDLLKKRTAEHAATQVTALPASRIIPWQPIRRAALTLLITAIPVAILTLAHPAASSTIATRLLRPTADLPPWSQFRFLVEPAHLEAIYGGELPLTVEISGPTPTSPVELLIRRPGDSETLRLPTFRQSETHYSRTLDSLTQPISIAFATGKARSEWHPVEILLQPKVLAGETTIHPPTYTHRPALTTILDTNELTALEGSEITLSLTSNRPLAPSKLIFTPATAPGIEAFPEEIQGELTAPDTITFRTTALRPGKLSALLRDIRGTPAAAPLHLTLNALPDQAPLVELTSPPRLLLATPSSVLQINGKAEDDFALSKVRLVRTLEGFRDRARTIAPALSEKDFTFGGELPLHLLGVSPGQIIELFLEASDHNPSLLGQGSSEISRIQIITEEDYAYRIRAKTTLQQFNARYQAIAKALSEARKSLQAMQKAARENDPQALETAKAAATQAHRNAAELLGKMAEDFPAFETEKRLKEIARNAAADASENLAQLQALDSTAPPAEQEKSIQEMLARLGAREKEQKQLQQDAALMAEAGKILELAAKFQQIYQTQKSLSERILTIAKEIHQGNDSNTRLLTSLADTQEKNRQALDTFATELETRAAAIQNPALSATAASAREFLQSLALSDPQSVMDLGAKSGRLGAAEDAYVQAELARALLENLMQKPNPFAKACQGQCMKFSVKFPDVNQTMQQLLEGLMCQNPGYSPGQGTGGWGLGSGGTGPTGNAAPGFGLSDIPVLGPQRMTFEPASLGANTDGKGANSTVNSLTQASESVSIPPSESPTETQTAPDPESIPESYRKAVQKYFTP